MSWEGVEEVVAGVEDVGDEAEVLVDDEDGEGSPGDELVVGVDVVSDPADVLAQFVWGCVGLLFGHSFLAAEMYTNVYYY